MSDLTRREVLHRLALTVAAAGVVDPIAALETHHAVQQSAAATGGSYVPKALSLAEFRTLERLTDLIIPVENGAPGAVAALCAHWIDTVSSENDQLKTIYRDGLTWLDTTMKDRGGADFLSATPALAPGITFFNWARRMTVDAFYTSAIGLKDVDYRGNAPMGSYPPPAEAIAYALKKSGL